MTLVALDPGHGGQHGKRDPGAVGLDPFELHEAEVVWAVCAAIATQLRQQRVPYLVTRHQREYVSPGARARLANREEATVLVSIHCNSHHASTANGFEVLHYPGSGQGIPLAESMRAQLATSIGGQIRDRGLKPRANLSVLAATRCPAVLVELPFIRNPRELAWLAQLDNQVAAAEAVAFGLLAWLALEGC